MHQPSPIRAARVLTQPLVGIVTAGLAVLTLAVAWLSSIPAATTEAGQEAVIAVMLVVGSVLAYQFPIHIGYRHKVEVVTVPIFLMVVYLSPPLAATAAGLAVLAGEMAVRASKGNYLSDIVTAAGRLVPVALLAALVAHALEGSGPINVPALLGAALTLWLGDILTLPLVLVPMNGDPPLQIMGKAIRESSAVEGAQYVLGFIGALAAAQQPWVMVLLIVPIALAYYAFKSAKDMYEGTQLLLERMADTIRRRAPYMGGDSHRVVELTKGVLDELQISGASAPLVLTAARFHDLGKICLPDHILQKPGPLTDSEWAVMRLHAEQGANMLGAFPEFAHSADVVRHHHEKWDGSGYPHRLKGRDIPLGARILGVIDAYVAMTSDRPYRRAMSRRAAVDALQAGRGTQWDPEIVDAFLRVVAEEVERSSSPRLQLVTDHPGEAKDANAARPA